MEDRSNTARTPAGLSITATTPDCLASAFNSGVIEPENIIKGVVLFDFRISLSKSMPEAPGIFISEIIRSNPSALSASMALRMSDTERDLYPCTESMKSKVSRIFGSSFTMRSFVKLTLL